MKKIIFSMIVSMVVVSNIQAEEVISAASDILKKGIDAYADIEKTRIQANKTEIDMTNVDMISESDQRRTLNINSNSGNKVSADKIKMRQVYMKSKSKQEESISYNSNSGNQVGH